MTHEELTRMGWRRMEFKPALSPALFLYSWSLIPIAFSILMLCFNKYNEYIFHAFVSAILLQSMSLYLVISRRKISLQYDSIRRRVLLGFVIIILLIVVQIYQIMLLPIIQIILTIAFSYCTLSSIQIYANNIGSRYEHPWSAQEKLSEQKLSNWNIQSYIFSNHVMAIRKSTEIESIAWISGQMENEQLKLVLDIFGHNPKDEFDLSSLQIDLQSND
jgi:hypothetical protein